jgi:hypothetical protein
MALRITDTTITSNVPGCPQVAQLREGRWSVTGYRGHAFDRNQALTAMTLAEVYALDPPAEHPIWRHVPGWRRELGLSDEDR